MNWRSITAVVLLMAAWMSPVQATVLVPDSFTDLDGITYEDDNSLFGVVIEDMSIPFSFSAYGGTVSGSVQSRVVLNENGTYDFYWRVFNDAESAGAIYSWRIGGFLEDIYDANWRIDSLGDVATSMALLFSDPGGFVNFYFTDDAGAATLLPGLSSHFFYIRSDATNYDMSAIYDLTNFGQSEISGLYSTFAPAQVPTFGPLMLMLTGLLALRRRQR